MSGKEESLLKRQVIASLDKSLRAFNESDPAYFNDFAKDATIYTAGASEPMKGREAYRRASQAQFVAQDKYKTITDRTVQVVGDVAVVAQTARITQADVSADVRQTLVYKQTDEGLKVVHSQTALIGNPRPVDASSVRVVRERIATVAPVLGVAQ
jgi:ketosteroid isomerase-like protein